MAGLGGLNQIPGVPTSFTATANGTTEIDLAFTIDSNTTTVKVFRSIVSNTTLTLYKTLGAVSSYADTGLTPGTRYWYSVQAFNSHGNSVMSGVATDITSAGLLPFLDTFDEYSTGALPTQWKQSDNGIGGSNTATIVADSTLDSSIQTGFTQAQAIHGGLARSQLIWAADSHGADLSFGSDISVSFFVKVNNVYPTGNGPVLRLSSPGQSFNGYWIPAGFNGGIALYTVVSGTKTKIGGIQGDFVTSGHVYLMTASVQGSSPATIKVTLKDMNTSLFFDGTSGHWVTDSTVFAINATDSTAGITGQLCGEYGDFPVIAMDTFRVNTSAADVTPPTVTLTSPDPTVPPPGTIWTGNVTITATATDSGSGMRQVDFYVDGASSPFKTILAPGPYSFTYRSGSLPNGTHTIQAIGTDNAANTGKVGVVGNGGSAIATIKETGSTYPPLPTFDQPLPNIMLANSSYSGFTLLQQDKDILPYLSVVDANGVEAALRTARPAGSYGIYTSAVDELMAGSSDNNTVAILDWLNTADTNGWSREGAFLHVNTATPFSLTSISNAVYPRIFWMQFNSASFTNQIVSNTANPPTYPASSGQLFYLGMPDKFRQITLVGVTPPSGGWTATLQYWNGTSWLTLTTLTDTTVVSTVSLSQAGTIDFDPPSDWATLAVASQPANGALANFGSYKFYYVRWSVTVSGTAPLATDIQSQDFTGQGSGASGTVPAYDYVQDAAHGSKGYLLASEYSGRATGFDAHFSWHGRAPHGNYGFGRYPTYPNNSNWQSWVVPFHRAFIGDRNFMSIDNMNCKFWNDPAKIVETATVQSYATNGYIDDLASAGQQIWNDLITHRGANSWVSPNLSNDIVVTNRAKRFVTTCPAVFLEDVIRPFSITYNDFESKMTAIAQIQTVTPTPIVAVDSSTNGVSYPFNGFANDAALTSDPQTSLNMLCAFLMCKAPRMMFSFYGASNPATSWIGHWSICYLFDLGTDVDPPLGNQTIVPWDSGNDPSNAGYTYRVYKRQFQNAVVLYKPCSFLNTSTPGIWGGGSTSKSLNGLITGNVGNYYQLLTPISVTGTASGNLGRVRVTTTSNVGITDGQNVTVKLVQGTTEANGTFKCSFIDSTHVDLVGTTFTNAFVTSPGAQMAFCNQSPITSISLTNGQGAILFTSPI